MFNRNAVDDLSMAFCILSLTAHRIAMGVMQMKCAWESFINLLPLWMRDKVDELGKSRLRELRIRINAPPELVFGDKSRFLARSVCGEDISFLINMATQYSPWSAETVGDGYITVPGGHRIGLCGSVVTGNHKERRFKAITSLCVRIARDFPGIARNASVDGSVLIIGRPGSGKTTFLRDLIRQVSLRENNRIAVVDERYELFPSVKGSFCFDTGARVDVLSGGNKVSGLNSLLRNMTPTIIAFDEITAIEDTNMLLQCAGCGVAFLATAHASDLEDLKRRPIYRSLIEMQLFQRVIILEPDLSWSMERCPS